MNRVNNYKPFSLAAYVQTKLQKLTVVFSAEDDDDDDNDNEDGDDDDVDDDDDDDGLSGGEIAGIVIGCIVLLILLLLLIYCCCKKCRKGGGSEYSYQTYTLFEISEVVLLFKNTPCKSHMVIISRCTISYFVN